MFHKGRKVKKSKKKKIISLIVVVAVAGTSGAVVYRKVRRPVAAATEVSKVQTAEVKKGNISNTITGTGNLELDDAEAVSIPSGLTIGDVLVESGDYVSAGTVLANVDSASVQTAMDEIQSELKELDEKIRTCQEDEDENAVVSSVSGRVKAIYVEEGSDVADIITEKGALIELSLDGYMAVAIEKTDSVAAGDSVSVTLSDGTVVTGTVDTQESGSTIITVTDNGTTLGDEVSVPDSDGNVLGSGTLYIHQPFEVTAAGGTVSSVSVTENEAVSADDELLVLEGTESSAEYEKLLLVRKARTETLQKLAQLARSPQIIAEQDGIVQDVNVAASGTTSSESSTQSSTTSGAGNASQMAYTGQDLSDLTFTQLSFDDGTIPEITEESEDDPDNIPDVPQDQQIVFSIAGSGTSSGSLVVVPVPVTGQTPVTEIAASDGVYSGVITWNPADNVFAAGPEYKALVVLSAAEGYCFTTASIQGIETGTVSGVHVSKDGKTLEFQIVFPSTAADNNNNSSDDQKGENGNSGQEADSTITDGSNQQDTADSTQNSQNSGTTQDSTTAGNSNSQSAQAGQSTGSTGASTSGTTGTVDSTSTSKEDSTEDAVDSASQYSTDVTAFTISPDENRLLSVSVDELDINSVELGQKAVVTFDAIEDQEFEGEVTKIGNTASVSGGVAKYTITITIPKDDKMKQGMNASATITIEDREDVLTLPMNALQEKGDRTFVYTEKDDDGNLSGETEVTTGLSDGSTVEITDGLEEGTTVYYLRSESSSSGSSTDMPDMQMPDMSGGGMDGGGMPQMDGNGGGDMSGGPGGGGGQGGPGK